MTYNRNYYDLNSEYDDDQSMADSQTDLYSGYNNTFRPHNQNGSRVMNRQRKSKKSSDNKSLLNRLSSYVNQDYDHLPEHESSNDINHMYQQPRNSRSKQSFINNDLAASPDGYQHYYRDLQQQHRQRRGSHQLNNRQNYEYPITPEDERSIYLYHEQPFVSSPEEITHYPATINSNVYMPPGSQHSEATFDDDDNTSFIEDTTTQRNTLINSESSIHVADDFHIKETIAPTIASAASPQEQVSPFAPYSLQLERQQRETEVALDQHNTGVGAISPAEKKKWFKSVINTALIIKKRAQNLRREGRSSVVLQHQRAMHDNVSSPPIKVISAGSNDILGDVLDSRQQQVLIAQLSQTPSPVSGYKANLLPEKTKITSLDRIWVFRLQEEETNNVFDHSNNKNIAWIGFDFENQLKIEQHIKELQTRPEDGRLALYDSHIRHKTMPVIVTPNDKKGYYFADIYQNELITLQITFIENDHQKLVFVSRLLSVRFCGVDAEGLYHFVVGCPFKADCWRDVVSLLSLQDFLPSRLAVWTALTSFCSPDMDDVLVALGAGFATLKISLAKRHRRGALDTFCCSQYGQT
ncbi:hypothetical protein [Parasitella parasitica]|uniref:Uncharacterized protein n=1 Tax=Parasitella parasitica TaxID=35722 RepID=A0A0B7MN98_9FUNG|nr:hypothetical protein [Parasitella parasitica]